MIYANPAFLSAISRTWSDVKGRTDREWRSDLMQAHRTLETDEECMAHGNPVVVEDEITGRSGPRVYLTTKGPLLDADGRTAGLFAIGMDITSRKQAEAHLRFLSEEMRHRVKKFSRSCKPWRVKPSSSRASTEPCGMRSKEG
jgi:hypothetical protein